jgi:hypothetical protein
VLSQLGFEWLHYIPWYSHPLILAVITAIVFIVYEVRSEWWLARTVGRLFSAPWMKVLFRDFFLGDQFSSVVISLQDLEYTICYFAIDVWSDSGRKRKKKKRRKPNIYVVHVMCANIPSLSLNYDYS